MAQGSIRKYIAKDKAVTWRARLDTGVNAGTGRRQQRLRTFNTKREAEQWLTAERHALATGTHTDPHKTTYGEFLVDWLDGAAARRLHPNSVRAYASLAKARIIPALGSIRLSQLRATHIEKFLREQEGTASSSTVSVVFAILRRSLRDAERLGLVGVNHALRVDGPRVTNRERVSWNEAEARTFLVTAKEDNDFPLLALAMASGIRIGELLALRWQVVRLEDAALLVSRTVTRDRGGKTNIGDPKSETGRRSIPLDPRTVAILKDHRTRQKALKMEHKDVWIDNDYVFANPVGELRTHQAVSGHFHVLCAQAGVPALTFHGLRHTAASLLAAHGEHPRVVADLLGHSSPNTTVGTYTHADDAQRRLAATTLANALYSE
jgi:integrase